MKKESFKKVAIVTVFAIAMAFLEAAVVIYLRRLFYVGGFSFPLKGFLETSVTNIEWAREFFTIVMLVSIALLAAKKFYERFTYFLYAFAVWDIFYYIWLKASLGWPASLLTWDVLFLIPFPWVGPVLAPLIVSVTMVAFAFIIFNLTDKGRNVKFSFLESSGLIIGTIAILFTFLYDYGKLLLSNNLDLFLSYIPTAYNWIVFAVGEIFIICAIVLFYLRNKKE